MKLVRRLFRPLWQKERFLIRLSVGAVFLSEGIQKFIFPTELGAGRFAKIGIPAPEILAPFVGVVEISCGGLLLLGLATRAATIPLLIDISVAIISTKLPMLLNKGFWVMAHEARTDYAMLLGLVYLLGSVRYFTPQIPKCLNEL